MGILIPHKSFHHMLCNPSLPLTPVSAPSLGKPWSTFSHCRLVCISYNCIYNYIICTPFCRPLLLKIIVLRFIHVVYINSSFLFIAEWQSIVWICYKLFHHLFMDIWILSSIPPLHIKLLRIFVYKTLYVICFHFSWVNAEE